MQRAHESLAAPDWSAVPGNSGEAWRLLQQRVAYFGAVMFLLSLAFQVFNLLVFGLVEGTWLQHLSDPGSWLHVAATAIFGLVWLACRSARRTPEQLNRIDLGGLVASIVLYALKGAIEGGGFQQATVTAMTSLAAIITHAIIVPATARRAFWVSLLASVPATVAAYFISSRLAAETPQPNPWVPVLGTAYIAMWSALTVAVATLASRIIYGLRQRAREAREIGQYTLEARIGAGGMGVVYRARHSLLRRPTAIKLLPLERAGERSIRRFEREVQLTSSLSHPNTIAVYDFGRTPDGIFYYVMEYLDGVTLQDLVQHDGPLSSGRVVHLLTQLCGALDEAHALGLVHRDIKPANLMLCVRGRVSDHVKVLDFGLVKEPSDDLGASIADADALIGTPSYMAPEGIKDPLSVTAAADIYAVGAVAYFLLVGEPAFVGSSVMEVCLKHVHEAPRPMSERTDNPVPPALDALVLDCLRKDPRDRPRDAATLRARLASIEGLSLWSAADADEWWARSASGVMQSVVRERSASAGSPGPQTLAIDWAARHAPTVPA
jgi:hypothetical protein